MGGLNYAGVLWALLSTLATVLIVGSLLYPEWLIGRVTVDGVSSTAYFGAYKRCNYPIYDKDSKRVALMSECGRYESFAAVPSVAWQVSIIVAGASACLSMLLTLLLIPSICMNDIITRSTSIIVGFFQVLTVTGVAASLALYAAGWDNSEVKDACGNEADRFQLGTCHVGRAFLCMGLGAFILCLCAVLSICGGKRRKRIEKNLFVATTIPDWIWPNSPFLLLFTHLPPVSLVFFCSK